MLPTLSSTLLLTGLLLIGLLFFIRASVKERIQTLQLVSEQLPEDTLSELRTYFTQRAYQAVVALPDQDHLVLEGMVRPSWFLAIFLSVLAAIGLLSVSLVLSFLFPALGKLALSPVVLAPAAGLFYWKKARRLEQICLRVAHDGAGSVVTIQGHRDELQILQQNLSLKPLNEGN